MTAIYLDRRIDDDQRRRMLYNGDLFVYSPNEHSMALVEVARKLIAEAFPGMDPARAQHQYQDVREYAHRQGLGAQHALQHGMREKAVEFVEKGAAIYHQT